MLLWKLPLLLAVVLPFDSVNGESICALKPGSYEIAKMRYPQLTEALDQISDGILTWYTDRGDNNAETAKSLVESCDVDTRIGVVVYGLPNKDCAAGYSSSGANANAEDYAAFLDTLTDAIGQRKVLYVLEPDAIGLTVNGGCGTRYNYMENLKLALQKLARNPNAYIYADVGHWTLESAASCAGVAEIIQELATVAPLKGVALNTANYRSNEELSALCSSLQVHLGNDAMKCLIDTSRNYNGPAADNEWCNNKLAGIGHLPTSETMIDNIDYFLYVKVPGESDGLCNSAEQSMNALPGPSGGSFFPEFFEALWNQGYFVQQLNMNPVSLDESPLIPTPSLAPDTTPGAYDANTTEPPPTVMNASVPVSNDGNANATAPASSPPMNTSSPPDQVAYSDVWYGSTNYSWSGSYSDSGNEIDGDMDLVYCNSSVPKAPGNSINIASVSGPPTNVSTNISSSGGRVIFRRPPTKEDEGHNSDYRPVSYAAGGKEQANKLPAILAITGVIAAAAASMGVAMRIYKRRNPRAHGIHSPSGNSRSLAATPIDHSAL